MKTWTLERLALYALALGGLPLAACSLPPGVGLGGGEVPTCACTPLPAVTTGPCYCIHPTTGPAPFFPPATSAPASGLSLADAYQDAVRYLGTQGAGTPSLISARSEGVMADGRSGSDGWIFVFSIAQGTMAVMDLPEPVATASPAPSPVAPLQEISLQVEGDGDVLAPAKLAQSGDSTISFDSLENVSSILATVAEAGGVAGPGGYSVDLRTDRQAEPVFDVVPSQPSATPEPMIPVDGPVMGGMTAIASYPGSPAPISGTYVLDAYTGAILALPTPLR